MSSDKPDRSRASRWRTAADVLTLMHREPGITRAAVSRRLHLSSGSAAEITARLHDLRLLAEAPASPQGRGRPTTILAPHPEGPLLLAAELRQGGWRCAFAAVDGQPSPLASGRHVSRDPTAVLAAMRRTISRAKRRFGDRIRAVSLAVAGTVSNGHLVQAATLGWGPVDLARLVDGSDLPLLVGNDATLAGVAEARTGRASGAGTTLHLLVEVGIGGALIIDGRPVNGATGAGGEYGHLPFGDRRLRCPCGARGCWDLEVDGRALARHLGEPVPADPGGYACQVLDRAPSDPRAQRALASVAGALAGGIAGLVNALDPDIVTLGGAAGPVRASAPQDFSAAYIAGLMDFRRAHPAPVLDAAYGNEGALLGAVAVGLDHITGEAALAAWANR